MKTINRPPRLLSSLSLPRLNPYAIRHTELHRLHGPSFRAVALSRVLVLGRVHQVYDSRTLHPKMSLRIRRRRRHPSAECWRSKRHQLKGRRTCRKLSGRGRSRHLRRVTRAKTRALCIRLRRLCLRGLLPRPTLSSQLPLQYHHPPTQPEVYRSPL